MPVPTKRGLLEWAASHYIDMHTNPLPQTWTAEIPETQQAARLIEDYSWHQFRGRGPNPGMQTIYDINQLVDDGRQLITQTLTKRSNAA